jgi:RecA/RadA recombinase
MAAAFQQGSIYVDTEHKVSLSRLQEMATQRHWQQSTTSDGLAERDGGLFSYGGTEFCGNDMSCAGDRNPFIDAETQSSHSASQRRYETCQNVLENLTVHNPGNTAELHRTLASLEEEILLRNDSAADGKSGPSGTQHRGSSFPVRLLVLDSIAAPARRDFGSGSAPQRAAAVLQVAQMLKRLADQFQLAVLVINQVGASSDDNSTSRAALGTSWHHCVSTRIQLEQQRGNTSRSGIATGETPVVRRATVVKSNLVGDGEPIGFKVTTLGVVGE